MDESLPERIAEGGLHPHTEAPQPCLAQQTSGLEIPSNNKENGTSQLGQRIGGLRPWIFWLIIGTIAIIVIAVSVGGAVGSQSSAKKSTSSSSASVTSASTISASSSTFSVTSSASQNSSSSSTATASSASSSTTAIDGYNILWDCPGSNGSLVTPNNPGDGTPGLYTFTKFCGVGVTDGVILAEALVPSFTECIALCSNWNYEAYSNGLSDVECTVAFFLISGIPPGNCWARNGTNFIPGNYFAVGKLEY